MSNGTGNIPACVCGGHPQPCAATEILNACGCCITPSCPPYDTAVFGASCPQGTVPDPRNPGCCSPGAPGASSSSCPAYETPGFPDPQSFGGVFCPAGTMADPAYPGCCAVTPASPSPSPVPSPIPSPGPYLPPGYGSYPGSPYQPSPYPGAYGTGGSLYGFGPAAGGVLCQLLASTGAGTTWLSELCALASVVLPILGSLL